MNNDISGAIEASKRFVLIPLPLVRELFMPKGYADDIVGFGIYEAAKALYKGEKLDNLDNGFLKDLFYCYYRDKDALPPYLIQMIEELADKEFFALDVDYTGFDGYGIFNPEEEVGGIVNYLNEDEEFYQSHYYPNVPDSLSFTVEEFTSAALEWCQIRALLKRFELKGKVSYIIKCHDSLTSDYQKCPSCAIGVRFLLSYLNNAHSEYDRMKLALLMGISSIIGMKRKWTATTKEMILCRMFGCKDKKELDRLLSNKKAKEAYDKYSTRKRFERLRDDLLVSCMVRCFTGFRRRTYVSILCNFDEIKADIAVSIAKKRREKIKAENRNHRKELSLLIEQLEKSTPLRKEVH